MSEYGLDPAQFLRYVIRPTLDRIALNSLPAQVLVLGTALTESNLRWLDQLDRASKPGPAYGLFQMEAATHADIWTNYLNAQNTLRLNVARLSTYYSLGSKPDVGELWANLAYATAMCRVNYRRAQPALPRESDAPGMARYHKIFYNSIEGATKVEESVQHFAFAARLCVETK